MRTPILLLVGSLAIAGDRPRRDLDVGIPPGSPTAWAQRFPVTLPATSPLRPITPRASSQPGGTVARMARKNPDLRTPTADGVVRILTWDIRNHLQWIKGGNRPTTPKTPMTGAGAGEASLPEAGSALYWICTSAFLRLMLHPQLVSESETAVHLLEIGDPVLGSTDAAAAEPALRPLVEQLRERITIRRRNVFPLPGATPQQTMMRRWIADELVAAHAFDPETPFAARLFWFAADIEDDLARYLDHPDPFLARNATAAMGRLGTAASAAALTDLAAKTTDGVVLARALGSLGNLGMAGDTAPLVARLDAAEDPIEEAALAQALGRLGATDAVGRLLNIAQSARIGCEPDRLQAALTALVRIHPEGNLDGVVRLAKQVLDTVAKAPEYFAIASGAATPRADRPDHSRHRGEVLQQLSLLLLARLDRDAAVTDSVLAMLEPRRANAVPLTNSGMGQVHPPVMMVFIETLPYLGDAGRTALARLADDSTLEPLLRAHAVRLLMGEPRTERLLAWIDDATDKPELATHALDLLADSADSDIEAKAAELLEQAAKADHTQRIPAVQRRLWLSALHLLERRGAIDPRVLVPLLELTRLAVVPGDSLSLQARRRAIEAIDGLVKLAAASRRLKAESIDAILQQIIDDRLNPQLDGEGRKAAKRFVLGQLSGLRGHRGDAGYQALVTAELQRYLLGTTSPDTASDPSQFEPPVPLPEAILVTIGRSGDPRAIAALGKFLDDNTTNPHRGIACLAAGASGAHALGRTLAARLLDEDPFVRYCAYRGLRQMTGEDFWADWMYGTAADRGQAASQYFAWCARNR